MSKSYRNAIHHAPITVVNDARRQLRRFVRTGSADSLHRLRVSLRAIRAWLEVFEDAPVRRARMLRERIRRFADQTGRGRDSEIVAAWVNRARTRLPVRNSRSGARVAEYFRDIADTNARKVQLSASRRSESFGSTLKLIAKLERGIDREAFAAAYYETIVRYEAVLQRRLHLLSGGKKRPFVESAHRVRIVAKKIRYLLAPLAPLSKRTRRAERSLKRFQELLGEYNDRAMIVRELKSARRRVASHSADAAVSGLIHRAQQEMRSLRKRLEF